MRADLLNFLRSRLWALKPSRLNELIAMASLPVETAEATVATVARAALGDTLNAPSVSGHVQVIPIIGDIMHRASHWQKYFGAVSTEEIGQVFDRAVADSSVKAIVLNIDSPGGYLDGTPELADKIFSARDKKRIVSIANAMMCSSAYWIGAAAHEVAVIPSGEAGSIGIWMAHVDWSGYEELLGLNTELVSVGKYKMEAHPWAPLSEEARARWQKNLETNYAMFVKDIARFRNVSAKEVKNGFGEGRSILAKEAKALGIVDRIATLEQTLERLGAKQSKAASRRTGKSQDMKLRATRLQLGL